MKRHYLKKKASVYDLLKKKVELSKLINEKRNENKKAMTSLINLKKDPWEGFRFFGKIKILREKRAEIKKINLKAMSLIEQSYIVRKEAIKILSDAGLIPRVRSKVFFYKYLRNESLRLKRLMSGKKYGNRSVQIHLAWASVSKKLRLWPVKKIIKMRNIKSTFRRNFFKLHRKNLRIHRRRRKLKITSKKIVKHLSNKSVVKYVKPVSDKSMTVSNIKFLESNLQKLVLGKKLHVDNVSNSAISGSASEKEKILGKINLFDKLIKYTATKILLESNKIRINEMSTKLKDIRPTRKHYHNVLNNTFFTKYILADISDNMIGDNFIKTVPLSSCLKKELIKNSFMLKKLNSKLALSLKSMKVDINNLKRSNNKPWWRFW